MYLNVHKSFKQRNLGSLGETTESKENVILDKEASFSSS